MKKNIQTRRKFKLRYRVLILAAVFVGALYFFSRNYLTVQSFELTAETTEMAEASLPGISMITGGEELNRLYGYTSNLDWTLIRESITPIDSEKTFTVRIDENKMKVRKLKYEIFDVLTGNPMESGTISALTTEEGGTHKIAKIKVKAELVEGAEYSVKITLITSTSKRVYYYTRMKMYKSGYLDEKLEYVRWFRDSALNKRNQLAVEKNLETRTNADDSSFAKVTIESSWEMVSWGEMQPQLVAELPPVITDFYESTAAIVLPYIVSVQTDTGLEYFMVRECFRFLYTDIRTYLYNYERETEAIYDVKLTSLSKDDLKLGITNQSNPDIFINSNYRYTAFVRNRELWCYDRTINTMVQVFSFREGEAYELTDLYDSHEVKILNLDKDGNLDFLVYGYMNRGEYEGRVGIVLYRYYRESGRIEEQAYFPLNTTYQLLKGELDEFVYMNRFDILYLTIFDTIYSYNLTTRTLQTIAEDIPPEHIIFFRELQQVTWQERSEDAESATIIIMNLETQERRYVNAPSDEVICLLGSIDTNLVFGYAKKEDIAANYDGTRIVPMYRLEIVDSEGTVRKEYQQEGRYVTDAKVEGNVIFLERVKKRDSLLLSYEAATSDAIQNRTQSEAALVYVTGRVTNLTKTEYYITFPGDVSIDAVPAVTGVLNTVISIDKTVRVTASETRAEQYLTYSFGRVVVRTRDAVDAIHLANEDESVGAVIDSEGRLVWERGVKSARSTIAEMTPVYDRNLNSLQAVLKMIFAYKGFDVDTSGMTFTEQTVTELLEQYLNISAVNLKGATLDEVLYYVYKKRPVIAITGTDSAVLICGYDASNIEVVDTELGKTRKINKEDAQQWFTESGSLYFSYID